jgi:hypothetical protein
MRLSTVKRTILASALAVATAVAGLTGQAQAFLFGEGDMVLAIYGNNTEALYNLGQAGTRLANGASFNLDVSSGLTTAQVGTNSVKYTVFEWDLGSTGGQILAATAFSPAQITGTVGPFTNQFNPSINMSSQLNFAGNTISKSDPLSFSNQLNTSGAGKFEGAWPVAMQGTLDQVLNVMRGDVDTSTFSQVGRVLLSSTGLLTIGNPGPTPVPLPAGVVLFGTGLIGLIGIARRSFNRKAA